ncbi:hypothetical protein QJS10_CPA05g00756 [Acorus calamus]|uniref:Uncharacterized protein n=1 Tax=Acorus calamus TaxID=4465 RepID=A0AAV9EW27_ACOCL|nr:hypothetical protein QJS10_CPA05g00756 [Acorus calamus]
MDSAAYFESDEHLRRQILLLLVDEEEGLKDTAPTRAAFGQLRLPIEDTLFNPYALGCGNLFDMLCACSSASVFLFRGRQLLKEPNIRYVEWSRDSADVEQEDHFDCV